MSDQIGKFVGVLDKWVKSYIVELCSSCESDAVQLYWEKNSGKADAAFEEYHLHEDADKVGWGFWVKKTLKRKSLIAILNIFLEVLEEQIPSKVALEEFAEIAEYVENHESEFTNRLKKSIFKRFADKEQMIRCYVEYVMTEIPDKEIFIQLSAMNYEKRVTHKHLIFDKNNSLSIPADENCIILDGTMNFEIANLRLIRKLMEISGEDSGLVIQQQAGSWCVKGTVPLKLAKKIYQVEIAGHSIWKLKNGEEELFEYIEGIYKLPPIGVKKDIDEAEYKKLDGFAHKDEQEHIESAISNIKKIASHGTGIIFIDEPVLTTEIERLASFKKAYIIKKATLKLCAASKEVLKGITAIDGALFCDFQLNCKAIGVIVDGKSIVKGNPGRGARYNSLMNYIGYLKNNPEYDKARSMAIVVSEDGSLDIETNKTINIIKEEE